MIQCECGPEKKKSCKCEKCSADRDGREKLGLAYDTAEPDAFMGQVETLIAKLRGLVEGTA